MIICSPNVISNNIDSDIIIFIAGGISNCPDWQSKVCNKLDKNISGILLNPRRNNWDMKSNENESIKQIVWEHLHLERANYVLFWFPEETDCPITLYELGKMITNENKILFIGCHPNYNRKLDVEVQTKLMNYDKPIYDNLEEMTDAIIEQLNKP